MHRNTIRTCACFREHARTGACVWACMQRIIYTKTQNGDRPRPLFCAHTTPQACAMVGAVCSCRSVSQMPCPAPYDPGTRNWAQRPLKTTTLAVTPQCSACHQGKRNTHTHMTCLSWTLVCRPCRSLTMRRWSGWQQRRRRRWTAWYKGSRQRSTQPHCPTSQAARSTSSECVVHQGVHPPSWESKPGMQRGCKQ